MDQVGKICFDLVAAIGGIGVIFIMVVKFSSNLIADKLQKKYDLKLNEELERYKANIENRKYISKTKFDAEFQLYRNLSKCFFNMVKAISILIPPSVVMVPADKEIKKKQDEQHYSEALSAVVIAQDELNSSVAFIPEEFYDKYEEIRKLCMEQLHEFEERWNVGSLVTQKDKETISKDAYRRTEEINKKFKDLNNQIRTYLDKLDVIE